MCAAVIKQKYEVQVYDEYVISGNTAVMRCQVPSYAAEFTIVTSWIQEDVISIYPNSDTGTQFCSFIPRSFHLIFDHELSAEIRILRTLVSLNPQILQVDTPSGYSKLRVRGCFA